MSASDHNSASREDHYPSRQGVAAHFIERDDPTIHAPLLKSPLLSSQQLASYGENGFLILDGLFSPQALETFQQELDRLRNDSQLQQLADRGGIVTATCKPGSVIIFDCNVMHGSNSNISPMPRSNLFFVYNALRNRVQQPFCDRPPRPEHICNRSSITPLRRQD